MWGSVHRASCLPSVPRSCACPVQSNAEDLPSHCRIHGAIKVARGICHTDSPPGHSVALVWTGVSGNCP